MSDYCLPPPSSPFAIYLLKKLDGLPCTASHSSYSTEVTAAALPITALALIEFTFLLDKI